MRGALPGTLVMLVGCGATASPPPVIEGRSDRPVIGHGAAPSVVWIDNGFDAHGTPAVTTDGGRVLLAVMDHDGGRGAPNLRLVVRDRSDRELERQVVMTADEAETLFDDNGKTAELDRRIATTNRWLRTMHERAGFVALRRLAPVRGEDTAPEEIVRATGDGTDVTWQRSQLSIVHAGTTLLTRATPGTWLVEDKPMCPTCPEVCSNPAFLSGAAIDVARRVAVITVGYAGTDTCWEPGDEHHVVTW